MTMLAVCTVAMLLVGLAGDQVSLVTRLGGALAAEGPRIPGAKAAA